MPARSEAAEGYRQKCRELFKLLINRYSYCLKHAGGWMNAALASACGRHSSGNNGCQLVGAGYPGVLATADDGIGDARTEFFFAKFAKYSYQFVAFKAVYEILGSCRVVCIHAHVKRARPREGKATFRILQLIGGNAEIQQNAIDAIEVKLS